VGKKISTRTAGVHTILYLRYFSTDFAQNLSSPPLALAQALTCACHAWAPITPSPKTELGRLGFAEAIEH